MDGTRLGGIAAHDLGGAVGRGSTGAGSEDCTGRPSSWSFPFRRSRGRKTQRGWGLTRRGNACSALPVGGRAGSPSGGLRLLRVGAVGHGGIQGVDKALSDVGKVRAGVCPAGC